MSSVEYSRAFGDFMSELAKLGDVRLSEIPMGRRLMADLLCPEQPPLLPDATQHPNNAMIDQMPDGLVDPQMPELPPMETDDDDICQLCSKFVHDSSVGSKKYDTLEKKLDHAQLHLNQVMLFDRTNTFDNISSICFETINDDDGPPNIHEWTNPDVVPKNRSLESTDNVRGIKRKAGAASGEELMDAMEVNGEDTNELQNGNSSNGDTESQGSFTTKQWHRQCDSLALARSIVQKRLALGKTDVQCTKCHFSLRLPILKKRNRYSKRKLTSTFSSNSNLQSISVLLLEHAMEHQGKKFRFGCTICSHRNSQCSRICEHMRLHRVKIFNFNVKSFPSKDEATIAIGKYFDNDQWSADVDTSSDGDKTYFGTKLAKKSTSNNGKKSTLYSKSLSTFLFENCRGVTKAIIPPRGILCCNICKNQTRLTCGKRILWKNAIVHAWVHLQPKMQQRWLQCGVDYRFAMGEYPKEIGDMFLQCFSNESSK